LQTDCSINLKQNAKRLLFDLFLANNDPKKAEAILNEVVREDPEELFTFIQQIRWQKINAKDEKIPALIEQAKAAIMPKTSVAEQIYLADILFSFGFYRDATEVYEKFVDPTQSTVLSTQLVEAYYRSGNYKKALILCQHLLGKYGALPIVSEMAAYIYEYIGDMDSSRIICEDFILTFPNELWMQLRLANINYVTGNYQDLDRFLDSKPDTKNLSLAGFLKLAQLNKIRKRIDNLLDVIYLMRQSFYDNMQAHYYYEMLYLEASKIKPVTQDYQTVIDGCGVFVRNEFENEQWFILEDLADANFARSELNTSKALYETLIGKGLGTVDLPDQDSFLCRSWVILVITDKYFAASQLSLKELENQPTNDFKIIAIPMVGDNIANEWVEKFIQELQKHNENFDLIKVDYINGKFPIGTFAYLLRKNPIEIWQNLIWGDYPFIHSWSDFQNEKFDDALITLQKGGLVVIDPISLITLHQLDVADDVVGVVGKFGIAHSTIDLFSMMLEMSQGIQGEGFTGFGANKGQGFFLDISPEQIAKQSDFLEKIINWARDNCMILPCLGALDINKDEHDRLKECIGSAFIDTKLIAAESGRILYSDDQWLRRYARLDTGVKGVWTQVILKYCFVQRNSNISLYSKSSLELVIHGYSYTIMDADILMEAAKLSKWQPAPIYKSALRALGDIKNTNLEYIAFISADFLRHLYLEAILTENTLIDPRDTLVFELLKIITSARSQTSLGRLIKEAIEKRFELIPIQKAKVLLAINSWLSIQSIIT